MERISIPLTCIASSKCIESRQIDIISFTWELCTEILVIRMVQEGIANDRLFMSHPPLVWVSWLAEGLLSSSFGVDEELRWGYPLWVVRKRQQRQ